MLCQIAPEDSILMLDGRTRDGTVGLTSNLNLSGTKWEFNGDSTSSNGAQVGWFKCLGDIDGSRILHGNIKDGTVGLTNDFLPGTSWEMHYLYPYYTIKCLEDVDCPRYLHFNITDGTVGLALTTEGTPGTKWVILNPFE